MVGPDSRAMYRPARLSIVMSIPLAAPRGSSSPMVRFT